MSDSAATALRLAKYWALTLAIVLGPYLAIRFGLPLIDLQFEWQQEALQRFLLRVDYNYWWVVLVYVAIAGLITPQWDENNLGLFGSRHIDNPFSWKDDHNRAMRNLAIVLFPGKVVWFTLQTTGEEIWHAFRS